MTRWILALTVCLGAFGVMARYQQEKKPKPGKKIVAVDTLLLADSVAPAGVIKIRIDSLPPH
ncbi:MAG TPA: hypothetical protein VM123_16440 [archaeon]|nr:hypothetical protein [archaeon]